MKKILLLVVAVVMCFSLTACKDDKNDKDVVEIKENENALISSGESENDSNIRYEFRDNTIEIDYDGLYKIVYHFDGDMVSFCDLIYTFDTEEKAIKYESDEYFEDGVTVERDGKMVIVKSDFSDENISRATVEAMAKTVGREK